MTQALTSIHTEEGVLLAAWPQHTCDCTGFMFCPSFKIPPPPVEHNIPVGEDQPQLLQDIVREVNPCTTCWDCRCKAAQNLSYKMARITNDLSDCQMQTQAALGLVGLQEQTCSAHWNLTGKEMCTKMAKLQKECKSMELSLANQHAGASAPKGQNYEKPR